MSLFSWLFKRNDNPFYKEENRMSRQALQKLLDAAAARDNKIDGVFIMLPTAGNTIMMKSDVPGFTGDPRIDDCAGWIGRFSNIGSTLSSIGYGEIRYALFPLKDAVLLLFYFEQEFSQPVVVGFFCLQAGEAEKAIGEMIYHAKNVVYGVNRDGKHIDGIKDFLGKLL